VEAGSASRTKSCPTSGWGSRRTCSSRTGAIQARVEAARERQRQRFGAGSGLLSNADALANPRAGPAEVRDHCPVDDAGRTLLRAAMQQRPGGTRMSARGLRGFRGNPSHPQVGADDR
jgi:predicted ATPase with chaperone activity